MKVASVENLQIIKESARDFAEQHIRPYLMEWDESQHFPVDLMHSLGATWIPWRFSSGRIWWCRSRLSRVHYCNR